ncbi:MAG: oxidoreductase [Gammaproteobacteria bacterium]|nr:oxidoreductase [Gammaproteobacteria bacterium]
MDGQKILVLFAHPNFQTSKINRQLVAALKMLAHVSFHDLYEAYPNLYIDVKREQDLLLAHDIIVFMHPFYWYSAPAILKEWQDMVLQHGFAYGETGKALQGKKLLSVISAGGSAEAYHPQGANRFSIKQLLSPFDQTAYLCGMEYLPPFVVHNTLHLSDAEIERHAKELEMLMITLGQGKMDNNGELIGACRPD